MFKDCLITKDFICEVRVDYVIIRKYIGSDSEIVIPNQIMGKPVVIGKTESPESISWASSGIHRFYAEGPFCGNEKIIVVTIEEYVTVEDSNASYMFVDCPYLQFVNRLPRNTREASMTFAFCGNLLMGPELSEGLETALGLFEECHSLKKTPAFPHSLTHFSKGLMYCTSLKEAVLPPNAEKLYAACEGCTGLIHRPEIPKSAVDSKNIFGFSH